MSLATLSIKNQIVIPKLIREKLRLDTGDKIAIQPLANNVAVIFKQPEDLVDSMQGVGKEMWNALGGADKYLKEERASWD
ncbi:MAG: AbrB/MazE/SpoVT family DNA-binding domain-containing protein [Patescibacteria group bacterium]